MVCPPKLSFCATRPLLITVPSFSIEVPKSKNRGRTEYGMPCSSSNKVENNRSNAPYLRPIGDAAMYCA